MNSVSFISYNGETIALCAARRNWEESMKVEMTLPIDITEGVSARESRRAFATSQRYTFEHLFDSSDAADSTDLRLWLNRLKIETVATPLWTDQVELSTACGVGATSLSKTLPRHVRSGSEWLILADDGSVFEIVVVTSVTNTTVTLASPGTEFAWPKGTLLYPLLFGRLDKRPEFEATTNELLSGRMKFRESSPYARKLNPRVVAAQLVGSHIPDFSTDKLWTVRPHWARMLDRTEADILYKQIGFGRQEQQYAFPNWNRRGLEMEFFCDNRDEMAAIESFFNDRKATTLPFFIPTFRGDLKLAANVASGATTFEIEESRYEDAAYDDHPGSAFLAFVDTVGIYPQRITEVDLTTITPQVAVGEGHVASETTVSFLMLVRFAEPKLIWIYDTDGVATCRIKFIEVADEYATPAAQIKSPAYLYKFEEALPNGTVNRSYYTSYEDNISFASNTYAPAPFSHGKIKTSLRLDNSSTLTSWGGALSGFTANPLKRFLPYTLNARLTCSITRVNRDAPNDGSARLLFIGLVKNVDMTGTDWKADLRDPLAELLDIKFPRFLFQIVDNFIQFEPPTRLNATAFRDTGAIASLAGGQVITVNSLPDEPTDWYSGGWIQSGAGANHELRSIMTSVRSSSTTQILTLDRPLVTAIEGQAIDLYPGYDGTREQCDEKYNNNINFGAHPFMPDSNQAITTGDIKIPSGGKKG